MRRGEKLRRAGRSFLGRGNRSVRANQRQPPRLFDQVVDFLLDAGYACDAQSSIATAVVEDALGDDRRLCVCVDGNGSLDDHVAAIKEQRVLEQSNWTFIRLWTANWVLDRAACERKLADACADAGVRPAPLGGAADPPKTNDDGDVVLLDAPPPPPPPSPPKAKPPPKRRPPKPAASQGAAKKQKPAVAKQKKKRKADESDDDGEWLGD